MIAIAPGGNVNSPTFREKLGDSVERVRNLVAAGKGNEMTPLADYEGAKGVYLVITTPAIYLTWFDPDGAMDQMAATKAINPQTPVLFIGPKGDYPGLLKLKQSMFDALPKSPFNKLYEPDASHLGAPSASAEEIVRWISEVAKH